MKKLGLFVGIDDYGRDFTSLRGAANDAHSMAALFQYRLGFQGKVLTHDDFGRGASIQRTLKGMVDTLEAGDLFVFFFAGHGKSPLQTAGIGRDQILLLPDVDRRALEAGQTEGTIGLRWVETVTEKTGVQRVFIIDACRSPLEIEKAETRDGEAEFFFDGEIAFRDMALRRLRVGAVDSPLAVFNSCLDKQRAIELRGKGKGLFTTAMIDVVTGRIDQQKPVVIDQLFEDEVARSMLSIARDNGIANAEQRPLRAGAALCLFDTNDRQNRAQRKLLESFDDQLARGALDDPIGDCARDSLAQLAALNLVAEQLQLLRERYSQALVKRKEAVDRDFDTRLIELARKLNNTASWLNYLSNNRLHEHETEAHQAIQDLAAADDALRLQKRQDEEESRVAAQKLAAEWAAKQAQLAAETADDEAWATTVQLNTVGAVQAYEETYGPRGRHAQDAQVLAEQLKRAREWAESIANHDQDYGALGDAPSVEDCERFLQRYPDSSQLQRVQTMREHARDDLAFSVAQSPVKEKGYNDYLSEFPQGRHASVAQQQLQGPKDARKRAREEQVERKRIEDASALESSRLLDESAWNQANSKNAEVDYNQYLNQFPKGAYKTEAHVALNLLRETPISDQAEEVIGGRSKEESRAVGANLVGAKLAVGSLALGLVGLGIWILSPSESTQPTTVSVFQTPTLAAAEPRASKDMTSEEIRMRSAELCRDPRVRARLADPKDCGDLPVVASQVPAQVARVNREASHSSCDGPGCPSMAGPSVPGTEGQSPPVQRVITMTAEEIAGNCAINFEFMEKFGEGLCRSNFVNTPWWRDGKGVKPEGLNAFLVKQQQLADAGDGSAMLDVAHAYRLGRGLKRDEVRAVKLYAAWLGNTQAEPAKTEALVSNVNENLTEALAQGLALPVGVLDWSAVQSQLRALNRFPSDYWMGLLAKCADGKPDLPEARKAFERAKNAPGKGDEAGTYKELAAGQLASLHSPCDRKSHKK